MTSCAPASPEPRFGGRRRRCFLAEVIWRWQRRSAHCALLYGLERMTVGAFRSLKFHFASDGLLHLLVALDATASPRLFLSFRVVGKEIRTLFGSLAGGVAFE